MEEATHTYGYGPGVDPEAAYRAAVRRDDQTTIAEKAAAYGMETAPDGAVIPAKLAGRSDGWVGDRSHREGHTAHLKALYDRMQEHADAVTEAIRTGQHPDSLISRAIAMRNLWDKIVSQLEED